MGADKFRAGSAPATLVFTLLALQPVFSQAIQAQDGALAPSSAPEAAVAPAAEPATGGLSPLAPGQDKRAYGILPNYRTAEASAPYKPLRSAQKFWIASKDTLDYPSYFLAGFFSGVSQLDNSNPSYGQGLKGYAKRYAAGVADQDIGNFMTEAIMPSLLHEDPRYFRLGHGKFMTRLGYAASRVLITKNDNGTSGFNYAEWTGNSSVALLGNLYYPDAHGFNATAQRALTQIGTDALSGVLKEFWPDVKRKLTHKREN
jgi:hypothetical protein